MRTSGWILALATLAMVDAHVAGQAPPYGVIDLGPLNMTPNRDLNGTFGINELNQVAY